MHGNTDGASTYYEHETGLNQAGLVTDPADDTSDLPVPVEDVVLLVTEEQALLIGGADGPADPADVRNGVLEIGPDGEVSALAPLELNTFTKDQYFASIPPLNDRAQ